MDYADPRRAFLPPEATLGILAGMQFERFFYVYLAIPFVLGIYLTYLAFTARPAARDRL